MPELPEVEVLVRHLAPCLTGQRIQRVEVWIPKSISPHQPAELQTALARARILSLQRRGKYLVFGLAKSRKQFDLVGHLGMTGRMYFDSGREPYAPHTAVVLHLKRGRVVFEDVRRFGRLTLSNVALDRLGPEPLEPGFRAATLAKSLMRSSQAIKVLLLDQARVAGIGNIYASEILFRARIEPRRPAHSLTSAEISRLRNAIVRTLSEAIEQGSTLPLDLSGRNVKSGLFYFGQAADTRGSYTERLWVYDREGKRCQRCRGRIQRIILGARSTYFCPDCQK